MTFKTSSKLAEHTPLYSSILKPLAWIKTGVELSLFTGVGSIEMDGYRYVEIQPRHKQQTAW